MYFASVSSNRRQFVVFDHERQRGINHHVMRDYRETSQSLVACAFDRTSRIRPRTVIHYMHY